MNFSAWSIRNPVAPILAFFMLMVLGWQSFISLPITRFPNIDVPLVAVTVTQGGAAPAELETQVAKEVEDAVAGIAGVKNVTTTITDGQSQTLVEFRMEVPTDKAVQDVKDAIDKIRGDLPADVDEPIVSRIDVEGQAILNYAVSAPDMTMEELSWFVDDTIKRALQGRPGVGRVDRYGGADREVRIELDPVRLGSWGITAQAVSAHLRATNTNLGSGRAELGVNEQSIRTLGNAQTVGTLSKTMISVGGGRHVRLADLGTITDTYEELRSFVRFNGQPAVTFAVFRAKGASEVSVDETVTAALDEIRRAHPAVGIELVDDTVFYTYGNYESALHTLMEGALLAVLVVLAFLRNWRATLISAVALPLSAVPTFYIMDLLGFSLNLVSFLAITLATGILVDDAIVEIENIARHIRMGKSPYRAAIEAADEIGLAVIATTFTIIAVFVPVSFMPGIPGQYFRQFGMTVAIAVAFSLLVARLITPLMAAYLMRSSDAAGHDDQHDGRMMRGYLWLVHHSTEGKISWPNLLAVIGVAGLLPHWQLLRPLWTWPGRIGQGALSLLAWLVNIPVALAALALALVLRLLKAPRHFINTYYLTLMGALAALAVSLYFMAQVPGDFLPPEDVSRISISVELPPGTTLDETERVTSDMYARIREVEGVDRVLIVGGSSPKGDLDLRRASIAVMLEKLDHSLLHKLAKIGNSVPLLNAIVPDLPSQGRERPQNEIETEILAILAEVPDSRISKLNDRAEPDYAFSILSNNAEDLNKAAAMIEGALAGDPLLANVSSQGALPRPELHVEPKLEEAARLGVTTAAIADVVRVATIGDYDAALAKLTIDDRQIPVRVRLNDATRSDIARIAALKVPTTAGGTVPLNAVATITISQGPAMIERLNRERKVTIGASRPLGVALDTMQARANEVAASLELPASVRIAVSGDAEIQAEMNQSFGNAMLMGLMLMLSVLILLFRSVIQPFTILFSLPLAIGGVAAALILTNSAMSMPVLIGILMLMGIVTKNAILLVDFAIEMRARGMGRMQSVIEAGHKRAQPIVMTSIAMSAGMLPSALGVGEGGAFRAPMATAVIGGLIVSTVLSLVVVPAFFLIMDDLSDLLVRLTRGLVGPKEAEDEVLTPEAVTRELGDLGARVEQLERRPGPGEAKPKLIVAE